MHEVWKKQQVHEDAREMYRTQVLVEKMENGESVTLEVMIWSGQMGRSPDMVQKVFGICDAKNGIETNELLQTRTDGHKGIWQNVEENSNSRRRQSPIQAGKKWRIEGQHKKITRKEYQRLVNKFEMEGFMGQMGLWNVAKEKVHSKEEGDAVREYKAMHGENFSSSWLRGDD